MNSASDGLIRLTEVEVSFYRKVLDKADCAFGSGLNGLIGKSGSGKSTIAWLLLKQLEPERGSVFLPEGLTISYEGPEPTLFPDRSLLANLKDILGQTKLGDSLSDLAKSLGVAGLLDRRLDDCSSGERKKLSIVFALAKSADLYLLDEPYSTLDEPSKDVLDAYFAEASKTHNFLLLLHEERPNLPLAHKAFLESGKIREEGEVTPINAQEPTTMARVPFLRSTGYFIKKTILFGLAQNLCLFFGCFFFLFYWACQAPSVALTNEISLKSDPYQSQLYAGGSDIPSFERFSSIWEDSISVFPLNAIGYDDSQVIDGYLLSYPGKEFLLYQVGQDKGGYNLRPEFAYQKGGTRIDGTFEYAAFDDERLSFLTDYYRFEEMLSAPRAFLCLCPEAELPYVVSSILNNDFEQQSYVQDGPVFYEGKKLMLPSPKLSNGELAFFSNGSGISFTPDKDYFLSSPYLIDGGVEGMVKGHFRAVEGEKEMSFGAYCYFAFCSSALGRIEKESLCALGISKGTGLQLDMNEFQPLNVIECSRDALSFDGNVFLTVSVFGFAVFLVSELFSFRKQRSAARSIYSLYVHNQGGEKARGRTLMAMFAVPALLILSALVFYFALQIPLANVLQRSFDYPEGYGELGAAYQTVCLLWFHLPSFACLYVVLPLLFQLALSLLALCNIDKK